MGSAGAAAATRATGDGPTECGASADHQRDRVARANGRALGYSPGAVWAVVDGVQPLLVVAALTQLNCAILTEATISFLDMVVKPPEPTWTTC